MSHRPSCLLPLLAAVAGLLGSSSADALEVQFEGFYRARGRVYDTLSLDRGLSSSEGTSAYVQHRLWLKPRFVVSENVALFTEIRGLDNVYWGTAPAPRLDALTGESLPSIYTEDLAPPTSTTEASFALQDFSLWRAWGEVHTPIGRFKLGRMPLHWGMGLWQNDGLGIGGEYGDTADRFQWEFVESDVWVRAAVDVNANSLVNASDEIISYNAAVGYRSETVTAGLNAQLRRVADPEFTLFTIDAALEAELGNLGVRAEGVGQFGTGDLETGANDVNLTAVGAVVDLSLDTSMIGLGLEGGLATGDADEADQRIKTFSFDHDYNIAAIMFEHPMPTLAAAAANDSNQGRSYDLALTNATVSNAIYIRPRVWRELVDGLEAEVAFIGARTARVPDYYGSRKSYGMEFDATLRYEAYDHVDIALTGGAFMPGSYYRDFSDGDGNYENFDDTVFGGQLTTRLRF